MVLFWAREVSGLPTSEISSERKCANKMLSRKSSGAAFSIPVFLISILCFSCHSVAQKSQLAAPTPPFEPSHNIVTTHQSREGKEVTIVKLERMIIATPNSAPIDFSSMFAFSNKSDPVTTAYISFYSVAPKCRFPNKGEATIIVDRETILV